MDRKEGPSRSRVAAPLNFAFALKFVILLALTREGSEVKDPSCFGLFLVS